MKFFEPKSRGANLFRDLAIILFSIIITILLIKTGVLNTLLAGTQQVKILGSFIAGMFFTSIFTTAPATITLAELARSNSIWQVAIFGGIGATIGDLVIFQFLKNELVEDFSGLVKKYGSKRVIAIFHLKFLRWFFAFLGALVIASPLPDELGLAMMGVSKVKTRVFIPLSFALNTLGILIIGLIAKSL
ncbi:MAG: hypothetical protein PHE24_02490 [Patescibacteria group bacterium]|nr:hypothetical protein [Patescibacteria group bacterium]